VDSVLGEKDDECYCIPLFNAILACFREFLLNLNLKEVQLHVEDSLGQLPVGKNFRTLGDIAGGCDILKMRDS
jgi:hypothetical protein